MENKNIDPKEVYTEYNEEFDKELMIDHDYDGIKELDNPPPPWLMWLFYFTVMWSVWYLAWYHWFDMGDNQEEEYIAEVENAKEEYKITAMDTETISFLTAEEDLAKGAEIFAKSCVACHGADGKGGIGSNLTDDEWIHGSDAKSVFGVIKNGTDKGMTSFASLGDEDILKVASYITAKL